MPIADHQLLLFPPVRPLADRFGMEFFRQVPERPGVYLMSTARDGVLYVGKARNLRRRLGSYRSATGDRQSRKLIRLLLRVERIDWDECETEDAALARERDLIRALRPRFNTMGVRPPKEWFIGWKQQGDVLVLELGEQPGDWSVTHGPFVFARPAFAALLRFAWLELHPGASPAQLPSRLLTWTPPSRWPLPWNEVIQVWLAELHGFLTGRDTRLPTVEPILPIESDGPVAPLPFDEQWRAMDATCLADFYSRIPVPVGFWPSSAQPRTGSITGGLPATST